MRRPQGQATLVGPYHFDPSQPGVPKGLSENGTLDTFKCGHCQYIVHVQPQCDAADAGGLCKCCMRLICLKCVDKGTCTPWEVAIEAAESRQAALRSYGLA